MIWLMLRGDLPSRGQSDLLEAALVPGVDHGPHAPSIAIARMAVTCGLPVNGAMASAINVLDDIHGGAGQQCMELYREIDAEARRRRRPRARGDRVHRAPPRSGREDRSGLRPSLPSDRSADRAAVRAGRKGAGRRHRHRALCGIGHAVETALAAIKKRHIPMNIDGITAVIFCELGFEPELGRGLFILSRAVGILAHAWEQKQQGRRIMGPMPKEIPYRYSGPRAARVPPQRDRHGTATHEPHGLRSRAGRDAAEQEMTMKDLISNQLVKYLEARGVEHMFGLCGHTNIAVLAALSKRAGSSSSTRATSRSRRTPPTATRGPRRRRRSCCRTSARG